MSQAYEPVAPLDNAHGLGQQQDTSPENLQPPPPSPLVDGQKDVRDNYEAVGDFGDAQYVPGDLSIMLQPPPPSPLVDGQKDVQDNYEAVGDFGDAQYVPGDLSIMLQVHSTLLIN
uniref:LIM interaction domain-containing protein n=1 Tax=Ascaris lumbricoides TaxID=6252 RepID=A0A0M3IUP4_ASCLU